MAWNTLPKDGSTFVVGAPGSGKTFSIMLIFDSLDENAIMINTRNKDYSKGPYVTRFDNDSLKIFEKKGKLIINTKDVQTINSTIEYFERNWDMEKNGKLYFIIDETDYFADLSENTQTKENKIIELFTKMRNDGILGVAMCQNIAGQIAPNIRKVCHQRNIFRVDPGEFRIYKRDFCLPKNAEMFEYYRYTLGYLFINKPSGKFPNITYTETPIPIDDETGEIKNVETEEKKQ